MAYATSNPPRVAFPSVGSSGGAIWVYVDGDAHTDVDATDYFSNGDDLGLAVDDCMIVIDTATPTVTIHHVTTVTAAGAATITLATLS